MKYKDFKQMSNEEMKNVVGGKAADEGLTCKTSCYKSDGNGGIRTGTCTKGTTTINGTSMDTCDCSEIGGTSCNADVVFGN